MLKKKVSLTLLLSFFIFIYLINPFNTPRFYLGFVIITILYIFYREKLSNLKIFLFLLLGIFFVFPFFNLFRRKGFVKIESYNLLDSAIDQFNQLHFDAYSNFIASIEYVSQYGVAYGYQLLGGIFFFIPRDLWNTKPISSGELIGNYLISHYYMNYNNLANPLISEFYLNFGLFGVIIGSILVAKLINSLESNFIKGKQLTYVLTAGFSVYLYRGDFMASFSYYIGTLVIVVLVPKLFNKVLNKGRNLNDRGRE